MPSERVQPGKHCWHFLKNGYRTIYGDSGRGEVICCHCGVSWMSGQWHLESAEKEGHGKFWKADVMVWEDEGVRSCDRKKAASVK